MGNTVTHRFVLALTLSPSRSFSLFRARRIFSLTFVIVAARCCSHVPIVSRVAQTRKVGHHSKAPEKGEKQDPIDKMALEIIKVEERTLTGTREREFVSGSTILPLSFLSLSLFFALSLSISRSLPVRAESGVPAPL